MTAALLHLCDRFSMEPGHLTIGIIGAGNVGSKIAAAASALGFKVLTNDPPRQRREKKGGFVSLDHLVSHSDIVTLHVPLTLKGRDATFHLAGSRFIEKMKRGAFLINTSRGGVTDEEEVKRALLTGQLAGYIADVWSGEPAADRELISMSVIATPHIAGYSADGKLNATSMAIRSFSEFFKASLAVPEAGLLPEPPDRSPDYSGLKVPPAEVIKRYVSHTYDIISDSDRFKANPDCFENLRNNYPLRREFGAYSIDSVLPMSEILLKLGFRERQKA
jgi:erythronate-4-phosphate dehydrogenase